MLIYNQDRIPTNYCVKDTVAIEVTSRKKLDQILQELLEDKPLSEIGVFSFFKRRDMQADPIFLKETGGEPPVNYNMVYDENYEYEYDVAAVAIETEPVENKGDKLYQTYERATFGSEEDMANLEIMTDLDRQTIINYIADACGIMPHFIGNETLKDKSIADLKKLSKKADIAYNKALSEYYGDALPNVLPTAEEALLIDAFTTAEKNQITDGVLHPRKAFDKIAARKNGKKDVLVNIPDIFNGIDEPETEIITGVILSEAAAKLYLGEDEGIKAKELATALFKEKYNFVPRVLDNCIMAECISSRDISPDPADIAKGVLDGFNRQNISAIVKYDNLALYGLSKYLNFNQLKESHIKILGNLYPLSALSKLEGERTNNFIQWYKNNTDVSDAILSKILTHYNENPDYVFVPEKGVLDIISDFENKEGKEECKKFARRYHGFDFKNNDLAIRGRNIEIVDEASNIRMYMLQADDYRNFTTGIHTHCCQRFDDAGSSCVYHLVTDPYAGNVVIERNGKILGQGYVWTDETKNTIVFDNMEWDNDSDIRFYFNIVANWAQNSPYENVHIGMGYNQGMAGIGKFVTSAKAATMPNTIGTIATYSDYHIGRSSNSAKTIKDDGQMILTPTKELKVIHHALIPSKYDKINDLGLTWLLSTGFSLEKMQEIAAKIENNTLSEREMMDLIRASGSPAKVVEHIAEIPENVQRFLLDKVNKDVLLAIKNPIPEIQFIAIEENPLKIKDIENPSEELCLMVVEKNGLYLSEIQNPTDNVIKAAVERDGFALTFVPPERQTEELKRIAVENFPRVIISIEEKDDDLIKLALSKDPNLVSLLGELPVDLQLFAIEKSPSTLIDMVNPNIQTITRAISLDGLLIRKYGNDFPNLRMLAINQNPFAIRLLNNITVEEAKAAILANEKVIPYIKDENIRALALDEIALQAEEPELD